MVKTRVDLKARINGKVKTLGRSFTTQDIVAFAQGIAPNICVNPHRISKYIKATGQAKFNNKNKTWELRKL